MKEVIKQIEALEEKIRNTTELLDIKSIREEAHDLEVKTQAPGFWDDAESAARISQELAEKHKEIKIWDDLTVELHDLLDFAHLAQEESDESVHDQVVERLGSIENRFTELEFLLMFSGDFDQKDAIVAIHAGSGGTEAQDWAEMLMRMILRFCERKEYKVTIVSESRGSEAGIKSATLEVSGKWAYGYLQSEHGVHRLVRISPFDADKARHTSFALVEVVPAVDETIEVEVDDKDLRIDTFAAGGKGGQSVNTTNSAVRIVHIPTNITVSCQNERSQHQNKEVAMKILKSKLHQLYLAEKAEEKAELRGEYKSAEWGNQARSYVLQPYQLVKDHRTEYEETQPDKVLDGYLDGFIEAYLRWKKGT